MFPKVYEKYIRDLYNWRRGTLERNTSRPRRFADEKRFPTDDSRENRGLPTFHEETERKGGRKVAEQRFSTAESYTSRELVLVVTRDVVDESRGKRKSDEGAERKELCIGEVAEDIV